MAIKPSSAKAKGRELQNWVRDLILEHYPELEADDVRSTSMGAGGEDVQLSPAARKLLPFSFECKSLKAASVYKYVDQASTNAKSFEPIVVLKMNRRRPLVLIDAEAFVKLLVSLKMPEPTKEESKDD